MNEFNEFLDKNYAKIKNSILKSEKKQKSNKAPFMLKCWIYILVFLVAIMAASFILVINPFKIAVFGNIIAQWLLAIIIVVAFISGFFVSIYYGITKRKYEWEILSNLDDKNYLNDVAKKVNLEFIEKLPKGYSIQWMSEFLPKDWKQEKTKIVNSSALYKFKDKNHNEFNVQNIVFYNDETKQEEKYLLVNSKTKNQHKVVYLGQNSLMNSKVNSNELKTINNKLNWLSNVEINNQKQEKLIDQLNNLNLLSRDYGNLVVNNYVYQWVNIESNFLELQNVNDPIKVLINHIYLISLLIDLNNDFMDN